MVRLSFSTQATELVELPDIPGIVVEISRVLWQVRSFTAATAIGIRLYHDVDVSKTLAFGDLPPNLWCSLSQAASNGGPAPAEVIYTPPYELIGPQRLDFISSAGTVTGEIQIHYTIRREGNRTVWNGA